MMRAIQMAVACGVVLVTMAGQVQAEMLTTQYSGGNSQSGNMFDVKVFANPLLVTSLDLNLTSGTWNIELYSKVGSYEGFESDALAWTLIDSVSSVTSNGANIATPVDFLDFGLLSSTTYGLYVTSTSIGPIMLYTDGTGVGNVAASNSDLEILEGAGTAYAFGSSYTPRIWNGTVHYDVGTVSPVPEPTSIAMFGIGACVMGIAAPHFRRRVNNRTTTA
ncbi:MAG: PEP-CTERM sorting domain-containing protein [Aureliella sp.]